jgi:uncharacterized membrane protein YuzA (DUF378 family)
MKNFFRYTISFATIAGGVNWITVALFNLNVVNYVLGNCCPLAERATYFIVGLASLYSINFFGDITLHKKKLLKI